MHENLYNFNCSYNYFAFISYFLSHWKKNRILDLVHRLLSGDEASPGVGGLNDGRARWNVVWWEKLSVLGMYQDLVTVPASIIEWVIGDKAENHW